MKIRKIFLSLAAVALTLNFLPKSYAIVESADKFEANIRNGSFIRTLYPIFFEDVKLKELKKINAQLKSLRFNNVHELKDFLRDIADPEYGRWHINCSPKMMAFLESVGQDGVYGNPTEVELSYIALISETIEEIISNMKNMEEAYRRVCDKPDRWPFCLSH